MNENILIYGSPEPSLWSEVVARAQEKTGSIVVVVPDQFKLETEQTLLKMLGRPLLHVQVMSFTGVARKTLSAPDIVPISHVGKRLFLIKILSENKDRLKIFGRHIHKPGFLRELGEILSDMTEGLKVQSLPEADFAGRVSNAPVSNAPVSDASVSKELEDKIHDVNLIYEAYSKISETYIGDEKLIGLAAGRADGSPFVKDSVFYIAHYDFFTDNEYALYRALLEHSRGVKMTLLCEDRDVYAYTRRLLRKIPSSVRVRPEREPRHPEERPGETQGGAGDAAVAAVSGSDDRYAFFSALSESMFSQDLKRLEALIRPYLQDVGRDEEREAKAVFSDGSPFEVYELNTRYNEAAYVGGRILDLIRRGVRPSEITVVLPNWEAYDGMLEHVLARKKIPFFVDRDRVFEETPLAAFISALLDYNLAPNQKHLAKMLATELFPIPVGPALKFRVQAEENRFQPDPVFAGILEMMRLQGLGERFTVAAFVKELYRILTTQVTYDDDTYSVMERCERHSFSMRHIANETTAEVEYGARIWNAFMGVLEELHELSGISGEIDLSIARLLIDTNARVARVPSRKEYVSITSPDRVRSLRSKYCFVLGALRGELPSVVRNISVFSAEEQEHIRDAQRITRFFDYEKEVYHIHLLLTAPGEKLIFTHPQGNRSVLLTYILEALGKRGYRKREIASNPAEDGAGISAEDTGGVGETRDAESREDALPMRRPEFYFSQSRIQSYLKCPFRYFIDYVVKAREERPNELSPMDSGNIVHRIMEIYVDKYSEADALRALQWDDMIARIEDSKAKCRAAIEKIYSEIAAEEEVLTADVKQGELYRRRFIEACTMYARVIDFQLAAGDYRVASTEGKMKGSEHFEGEFEADFSRIFPELFELGAEDAEEAGEEDCGEAGEEDCGEAGEQGDLERAGRLKAFIDLMNRGRKQPMTVHLNGTFDRMDRTRGGYRLIDYKTGDSYDGKMSKLFLLDYIQLGLYAYLIELQEAEEKTAEEKTAEDIGASLPVNESEGGEKPEPNLPVKNAVCEGLNILNLVDAESVASGKGASAQKKGSFPDKPMQGVVSVGEEARRHYCRLTDRKDAEGYERVVKKRSPKINPNHSFLHSGEEVERQRKLLKTALFEAFDAQRGRSVNIPALLRDAGARFFEGVKKGNAGGIVEFDIIILWSRLITWAVAKSIAAGDFEPDTSDHDHCKYCNFKAICRYELRRG